MKFKDDTDSNKLDLAQDNLIEQKDSIEAINKLVKKKKRKKTFKGFGIETKKKPKRYGPHSKDTVRKWLTRLSKEAHSETPLQEINELDKQRLF